jgi:DNA repair exonuclease SbcCD nuclease subunit
MKFLHAADLHLRVADADEQLAALKNIVGLAAEHQADFLLFAGDLFDSDHDADQLRFKVREALKGYQGPTVLVPGNHDAGSYRSTADYGENVLLAQEDLQVFQHLGELPLVCLPYRDGRSFGDCREGLARVEGPFVVCCHGTLYLSQWIAGWLREEKEEVEVGDYFPVYPEDLGGLPIRYLAMGHFHKRFYQAVEPVPCCYPGSAFPVTARELGPRSVALVELEGDKPARVTPIALENVPWYQEVSLKSLPWREEEMFSELEHALSDLNPRARPVVSVRGYAQDERGLRERLEKRLEGLSGPDPQVKLSDYGRLMENSFYHRFVKELGQEAPEGDQEEQAVTEKALEIITLGFSRLQQRNR